MSSDEVHKAKIRLFTVTALARRLPANTCHSRRLCRPRNSFLNKEVARLIVWKKKRSLLSPAKPGAQWPEENEDALSYRVEPFSLSHLQISYRLAAESCPFWHCKRALWKTLNSTSSPSAISIRNWSAEYLFLFALHRDPFSNCFQKLLPHLNSSLKKCVFLLFWFSGVRMRNEVVFTLNCLCLFNYVWEVGKIALF